MALISQRLPRPVTNYAYYYFNSVGQRIFGQYTDSINEDWSNRRHIFVFRTGKTGMIVLKDITMGKL